MKIALFNVRITFQRPVVTVDDIGNHINTWENFYECWATALTPGRTKEENTDVGQALEQENMDFTVRFCSTLADVTSTNCRIVMKDRIYDVDNVNFMAVKNKSIKFNTHLVRR